MAQDSFKGVLSALLLFVVFSSMILSSVVYLGNTYGVSSEEIGGGSLNISNFESSISDVETIAEAQRQNFEGGEIEDVDTPTGIFSTLKNLGSMITQPFSILSQVLSNILHIPTLLLNVILAILSIVILLSIWQVIRMGN